jgi:predicted dehydrogenase
MNFCIIGLGSMGKRRVRCLKALGQHNIVGYDQREDRRNEARSLYNIDTVGELGALDFSRIDACIISTPPDKHAEYMRLCLKNNRPAFVEASVVLEDLRDIEREAEEKKILIAPSCTLRFHPSIRDIKSIVTSGAYGKITNFSYHAGQFLPDWHPWEKVADYYVSKKEVGGGREIVPFELTWIVDTIGYPEKITGFYGSTMDVGANIDDTYVICMKFTQGFGSLVVDVTSRYAVRSLILNMERGQIAWRWDENIVRLYEADSQRWVNYHPPLMQAAEGYNKNIIEVMYIQEIDTFIRALSGNTKFPNSLEEDIKVLELLERMEKHNE